ncbi:uncharacterized protein LOC144562411 isoform X2 [Carex rostrata]
MTLSRLLFSEAELHLTKEGFSGSRRWLSASLPAPPPPQKKALKKSESTKEKRTEDVLSFVERYREEHSGLFPKISEVYKAVGGSYKILKGIFSEFQEKYLHCDPTPRGEETAFTKPCPKENLNESMNEMSSSSGQTKQCVKVFNETTSSSTTNIKVLTESSLVPPVDEKPPIQDQDSLKIEVVMADMKNIESELNTRKMDFKQRKHLSGSKTRHTNNVDIQQCEDSRVKMSHNTSSLHNLIKGLQNGPKSTVETTSVVSKQTSLGTGNSEGLGSVKEELLERRDMSGTKGSSVLEKENNRSQLFDVLNQIKTKPGNSVDDVTKTNDSNISMHNNMIREENGARNRDPYAELSNIFSPIITKSEKRPCPNTGSWADTLPNKKNSSFKALDFLSETIKDVRGVADVLSKGGINEKVIADEDSDSDTAAFEYLDSKSAAVAPIPISKEKSKYGLFVSFLDKTISVSDVCRAFDGCGTQHEVSFTSKKLAQFNCANVFFKAEQGLKNALNNTDPVICNTDVVARPMASLLSKRLIVHADLVVQDPDFPANLLKYPSRSVAIKGLTENLPFNHLRSALGLWGPISGVAIGKSNSSLYVEFETEESKERVLEAASVTVLGKKLQIYRVHAPKTTVVRVFKVNSQTDERKIQEISNKFSDGKVKRVVQRGTDIFDVHFKLSELPKMLKILNSLNGLVVDQSQWVVQPATFFPVGIIQSLWDDPHGRKQVQDIFNNLCMKVNGDSSRNSFGLWSTVKTAVE